MSIFFRRTKLALKTINQKTIGSSRKKKGTCQKSKVRKSRKLIIFTKDALISANFTDKKNNKNARFKNILPFENLY